jgi:ubiquinone/menaquinone biosynthesis C-methylase UbiE
MPDTGDEDILERWERSAAGWSAKADSIRDFGMPVSAWMIEQLRLQPGQRVLELAAGPGDTGFMAAELVSPGGSLISTDGAGPMLDIARERAQRLGVENVEFKLIDLQWIDLDTASVDAALCRWGLMFLPDPGSSLQEIRRVLRPGGRAALAVWAGPELNPWATIPTRALVELGHVEPPDPTAPGMFTLGDAERLQQLLESAGFTEVVVEPVELSRPATGVEDYVEETLALSSPFGEAHERLSAEQWDEVTAQIARLAEPFTEADGSLRFPACSLAVAASS